MAGVPVPLNLDTVRDAPKVLLHDHLDGGLRPTTILELADAHRLPGPADPGGRTSWAAGSVTASHSGSLERYLETFGHTVAVMQDETALVRVAAECAQDLAADGVVYAEVRFAPELHVEAGAGAGSGGRGRAGGLPGRRSAGRRARPADPGRLPAHRDAARRPFPGDRRAGRALPRPGRASGFDIAGAEAGFPPTRHLDAFEYLRQQNAHFTIHAGEAFGLPSIWEALQWCGADRLGHGVRIVDDINLGADGTPRLGRLAAYVRDKRIPLEMCPTSNVHTGAAKSLADHPIGLLAQLRFRVTVNTDNRLMSDVLDDQRADRAGRHVRLRLGRPAVVHGERHEVGLPRASTSGWP